MELISAISLNHDKFDKNYFAKELRNRLEKYTIDPEFDVNYFAKKAMYVLFNTLFSEFFGVDKKELIFEQLGGIPPQHIAQFRASQLRGNNVVLEKSKSLSTSTSLLGI